MASYNASSRLDPDGCPHCGTSLAPPPQEHPDWCFVWGLFGRLGQKDAEVERLRAERDEIEEEVRDWENDWRAQMRRHRDELDELRGWLAEEREEWEAVNEENERLRDGIRQHAEAWDCDHWDDGSAPATGNLRAWQANRALWALIGDRTETT